MADYWKSQAKKFCDFCKCWIADNKPSIGFHESGKRHKENVTKRLAEISKTSAKSFKESQQVDHDMRRMEEEALKAYMKDLQENPDYTSRRIVEETERRRQELEESVRREKEADADTTVAAEEPPPEPEPPARRVWKEAKSDEGYTYYWHVDTAEARWEAPEEGYVSIEEQDKQKKEEEERKELKKRKKEEKAKKKQEALQQRENVKKRKKNEDKEEDNTPALGPAPKPDPYGAWTTIEPKVEEPLDLELPQQEFVAIKVPELAEPELKFKEKTIASLEESELGVGIVKGEPGTSPANFKKRKFNRGNVRQKLDTD